MRIEHSAVHAGETPAHHVGNVAGGLNAYQVLTYLWRQLEGPRGTFGAPFSAVTTFTPPDFVAASAYSYIFELTVDASPPGDRSEPILIQVNQQAPAGGGAAAGAGTVLGGGGGGGCAFVPAGGPMAVGLPGAGLFLLLLGGGLLRRRRASG